MARSLFRSSFAAALLLGWLMAPSVAIGQWARHVMPTKPGSVDGFTGWVEVMHTHEEGYLPVRYSITPITGSFPGDRQLWLRAKTNRDGNKPVTNTTYSCPIRLEAGKTSASGVFYLPKYYVGLDLTFQLYDADGAMKDYKASVSGNYSRDTGSGGISAGDIAPQIAVILPNTDVTAEHPWQRVPDLRSLDARVVPNANYLDTKNPTKRLDDGEAIDHLRYRSIHGNQTLRLSEAHTDWRGYESCDVVLIAYPLLEQMQREAPQAFQAIREWISCGGVLWTFAANDPAALAQLLDMPRPGSMDSSSNIDPLLKLPAAIVDQAPGVAFPTDAWMASELISYGLSSEDYELTTADKDVLWTNLGGVNHPYVHQEDDDAMRRDVTRTPLGAGVVIAMAAEDPFPGSFRYWQVVRHFSAAQQYWDLRRGTTILQGHEGFWDWILANVAKPPVYAFLTVLSVFVLAAGPISYYWTRRVGRTYLMFLISPALATLATLALFGYGFVADGFQTRVRVRQLTWSDGAGHATARMTRSTYFAAFRPSDGLRFPASAAVYPVLSTDEAYDRLDRSQASPREIVLGDESQQFLGDFLTPRNQTQFVHYEPKAAQEGLRLVADPSGTPRVANHLSETLHQLVARSADGTYWMLPSPCPSGETAPLAPLANHQRMEALRDLYQVQPLEPPPGFVPPIGRRYYYYAYDARSVRRVDSQSWSQSGDEEGVFEAELRVVLTSHRDLRPGSFVGVADLSADALAIEGAEVTDSIHYVMGNFLPEGVE